MATMRCLFFSLLGLLFQPNLNPSVAENPSSTNDTATTAGPTTAGPTTAGPTTPAPTTLAPTTPPPNPCEVATVLNDAWRNFAFAATDYKDFPNSDSKLKEEWLRFTGIGGDRIINTCKTVNVGGTTNNIYLDLAYPHVNQTTVSGTAYVLNTAGCGAYSLTMEVMFCPGDFFIYKTDSYPITSVGFVTYHFDCTADSCGPEAECSDGGGCVCAPGFELLPKVLPTPDSYGCSDIDECANTPGLCGANSECVNDHGGYTCKCLIGYEPTNTSLPPSTLNLCIDINECLDTSTCLNGVCANLIGSFTCVCNVGFRLAIHDVPECDDIDECDEIEGLCGPNSICNNTIGSYCCKCQIGYLPTNEDAMAHNDNVCIDVDECMRYVTIVDKFKNTEETICGPYCNCTNNIGSYFCNCFSGFRLNTPEKIASVHNPCVDIDECSENPGICGTATICTNVPGTFYCSCPEKYYPNTGLEWFVGTTFCEYVQTRLKAIPVIKGKSKEGIFFEEVNHQLDNLTTVPVLTLANGVAACMEIAGVGPLAEKSRVTSDGDSVVGTDLLQVSDRLVTRMASVGYNQTSVNLKGSAMDLSLETYGYSGNNVKNPPLAANGNFMEINMELLAENNNNSAAAAFVVLNGIDSVLSHTYFKTKNRTEMLSDVITAVLPLMNNTNVSADPVNFTIQHKKSPSSRSGESGTVTCVYWKVETDDYGATTLAEWSTDGCTMTFSNENYTICSCTHLSTFALILQIAEPPEQNDFLDWLNRICVIVGLFFFALAVLTFLLCSWNPKINNTARLHLCLNLGLSHLLMLFNKEYVDDRLACKVLAGLLHFLIVASFVWMQLEAVQLFMLVRKLTKVQVIKRDGLPRLVLYFVGYGVPMVIVGVSAVIYSDGYGAYSGTCWLSTNRHFNWALTGPVIAVLALNCSLFAATLWSLRTTIANMRSGASGAKETRLVLFKIIAQFVILGCTWIIGLYQTNLFFQVLFIVLNSQQGTFLYIVHCVLNKEIREEYIKWLTCAFLKQGGDDDDEVKDVPSVSEDLDKTK